MVTKKGLSLNYPFDYIIAPRFLKRRGNFNIVISIAVHHPIFYFVPQKVLSSFRRYAALVNSCNFL